MSSIPPFVRQSSTSSVSSSSAKSPKPSFRERYQLDSPSSSPRTPNAGEEGFNSILEENRSPSNHMVPVTSSKARSMALHEVLLSRREKERPEQTNEQKKAPFSVDFPENRSSPRSSPRTIFESKDYKDSTPTVVVSSEDQPFGDEDEGKEEVEDPVQAHLDRIMNRRKERASQPAKTEPTPVMDTPKREQDTNEKLQAIFERRKNREVTVEIKDEEDSSSNGSSSSQEVGNIMTQFLKQSVENSRESSPVPSGSPPKAIVPKISFPEPSTTTKEPRESTQTKTNESRSVEEKKELTPTMYMDHLKNSPLRGSPKMLRFKEEDEISRPIEALPQNVSLWRITGERWKLFNISSFLSKESMAILSNRNSETNEGYMNNFETDTDQGESYNQAYPKVVTNPYPSYPYDPKPATNPFTADANQSQPRTFKFRNLDELYQGSFEVPTDSGHGKRLAFRAELSGNFMRCLKTNQIFNQFLSIEDEVLNRMVSGKEVLKNTPKGKVHKRFLFIDPKNKELVWSENEKKKTGIARSSRRIKLSDITQLKALEMTPEQARVMKIPVVYDRKIFGLVLVSRSRTAEFIINEKASEFLATIVAISLAAHKYGSSI